MKLYELLQKSHFKLTDPEEIFFLDHIDGMYSLCYNDKGEVVHFAAWTEVIPIDKPDKT